MSATKSEKADREETGTAPALAALSNVVTAENVTVVKQRIVRNLQKHSAEHPLSVDGRFCVPLVAAIEIVTEGLALEE